jgi:hypothetical protein
MRLGRIAPSRFHASTFLEFIFALREKALCSRIPTRAARRSYVILRIAIAGQKRDLAGRDVKTPQRSGYEEAPFLGQKRKAHGAERAGSENADRDTSYLSGSPTGCDWIIRTL